MKKRSAVWKRRTERGEIEAFDKFDYGFMIGKLVALEWALGVAPSSDVSSNRDFGDWRREQKESANYGKIMLNESPSSLTEEQRKRIDALEVEEDEDGAQDKP